MAKTANANATTRKAFGKNLSEYSTDEKPVPAVLETPYSFEELELTDVVPDDEKLSEQDILDVINARRNATARAAAVNKALGEYGITPPALTDAEKAVNSIIRGLVLMGNSEADARSMAEAMLAAKK